MRIMKRNLVNLVAAFGLAIWLAISSAQPTSQMLPGALHFFEVQNGYDPQILNWIQTNTSVSSSFAVVGSNDLARWISQYLGRDTWVYPTNVYTVPKTYFDRSIELGRAINSSDASSWNSFISQSKISYLLCTTSYCPLVSRVASQLNWRVVFNDTDHTIYFLSAGTPNGA
jgi:hypothetical protein